MMKKPDLESYIRMQQQISIPALQLEYSVDYRTVRAMVKKLEAEGILVYTGGVTYAVKDPRAPKASNAADSAAAGKNEVNSSSSGVPQTENGTENPVGTASYDDETDDEIDDENADFDEDDFEDDFSDDDFEDGFDDGMIEDWNPLRSPKEVLEELRSAYKMFLGNFGTYGSKEEFITAFLAADNDDMETPVRYQKLPFRFMPYREDPDLREDALHTARVFDTAFANAQVKAHVTGVLVGHSVIRLTMRAADEVAKDKMLEMCVALYGAHNVCRVCRITERGNNAICLEIGMWEDDCLPLTLEAFERNWNPPEDALCIPVGATLPGKAVGIDCAKEGNLLICGMERENICGYLYAVVDDFVRYREDFRLVIAEFDGETMDVYRDLPQMWTGGVIRDVSALCSVLKTIAGSGDSMRGLVLILGAHKIPQQQRAEFESALTECVEAKKGKTVGFIVAYTGLPMEPAESLAPLLRNRLMLYIWGGTADFHEVDRLGHNGDALFAKAGEILRVQTVKFSEPAQTVQEAFENERKEPRVDLYTDPTYLAALRLVIRRQSASISLIQRYLGIHYSDAAEIVEWMECMGYISPFEGRERKVFLTKEEYIKRFGAFE